LSLPLTTAVLPSADNATLDPKKVLPAAVSALNPCWLQVVPDRVNTQAAPDMLLL
jgi:hypothetical protein